MCREDPWFPMYVKDFLCSDKVDAMCPVGRGAYIMLLCKAWHAKPPATIPTNDSELARMARLTQNEWEGCKQKVLAAFEPCGDSRMVQPRLRKEYDLYRAKCNKASVAAEISWEKRRERDAIAMRTHSDGNANALIPASVSDSGSDPPIDSSRMADFAAFWRLYPLRKGKGQAERAWERAARTTAPTLILEAAREYAASPDGQGQFCPHASTWLNGKKWADDRWTWWGKEPLAAQKERSAWIEKDKAISWWATLTPEEQKQTTDSIMELVRNRPDYDPIRQAWERDHAAGRCERFAVEAHKRKGKA